MPNEASSFLRSYFPLSLSPIDQEVSAQREGGTGDLTVSWIAFSNGYRRGRRFERRSLNEYFALPNIQTFFSHPIEYLDVARNLPRILSGHVVVGRAPQLLDTTDGRSDRLLWLLTTTTLFILPFSSISKRPKGNRVWDLEELPFFMKECTKNKNIEYAITTG